LEKAWYIYKITLQINTKIKTYKERLRKILSLQLTEVYNVLFVKFIPEKFLDLINKTLTSMAFQVDFLFM